LCIKEVQNSLRKFNYAIANEVDSDDEHGFIVAGKYLGDNIDGIPDEYYFYPGDVCRTDPDLVTVVEKLGGKNLMGDSRNWK
jgi:hypothetical protein